MGRLVCLPQPTTMTALVLSRGSFHGAPTNAQPRHNQRSPDGRRTARCSEDQAHHDHGGTVARRKQRRVQLRSSCTSPAPALLYRTLLLRAGNSWSRPCGTLPVGLTINTAQLLFNLRPTKCCQNQNCKNDFELIANDHPEDPAACKWSSEGTSLLQIVIGRIRPLENSHPEDPATWKWSSGGSGHLEMIMQRVRPLANDHPEDPANCKW